MLRATVSLVLAIVLVGLGASSISKDPDRESFVESSPTFSRNPSNPDAFGLLARGFTANVGQQADTDVRFYFSSRTLSLGLASREVRFVMATSPGYSRSVVRATFENAHPVEPIGVGPLAYPTNFLMGSDSPRTQKNVPSFRDVAYRGLYDGIDLVFTSFNSGVKYEFLVLPGAHMEDIRIRFQGTQSLWLDGGGNLQILTAAGSLVDAAPFGEQMGNKVACRFDLRGDILGYRCPEANAASALRIDPIIYATYLGSSGSDDAAAIVTDASGNVYIAGTAGDADFPTTAGAFDRTFHGGCDPLGCGDAFVAKLNPSGSALVYATFLGGSAPDHARSIAVDGSGNVYVTGETYSSDFPTTLGAFDRTFHGEADGFVAKLNADGSALTFSSFLGGASLDVSHAVVFDSSGNVYVAGYTLSSDFPTTPGVFNRTFTEVMAFVTELSSDGSSLVYSTFLGEGYAHAIAVDPGGNAFVAGETEAYRPFPTTPGAFQTTPRIVDGFVTKLNPSGSGLLFSTFLGGVRYDYISGMTVDPAGNAFLTGNTNSSDFPVTPGAWNMTFPGPTRGGYVYVASLNASGSTLNYATFIGGTGDSWGRSIAVDPAGQAYIVGYTTGGDFPTTPGAIQPVPGGDALERHAFISELNAAGSALLASTYLGGTGGEDAHSVLLDADGRLYVSGITGSADFPVTQGAFDTSPHVNSTSSLILDGFVVKLSSLNGTLSYKTTVMTAPSGLRIQVNGTPVTAPFEFWCTNGTTVWVNATSPQVSGSFQYWFASWSDGGAQDHTVTCPIPSPVTAYYTTTPQPDFVLFASPSRTITAPGGNASVDLTVLGLNGYAGSIVNLSLSGAPSGVAGSFSPAFITPSGTATLVLSVSSAVAPGVYPMHIRGDNGSATRSVPFQLEVLGLQIAANTTALAIEAGSIGSATVTVTLKGNYTSPVVLSVTDLPAGVGVSVTTAQFFATGVATMTFIVAPNAPAGTYAVAVTAAGGGITRALSFDLQVLAGGRISPSASDWTTLLGWFVGTAALAAAVIYLVERRKR